LKRADIFDLIEYGVSLGLEISITPSATPLLTREAVVRLKRSGISRLAVSLDGPDARRHDAVRGVSGSFLKTRQIVAEARSCGLPVQVNTTLTPDNYRQIPRFANLIAPWDIVLWSVFFLVPMGRAAGAGCLSAEQCESAFDLLWRESQSRPFRIKTTEAPHYRRFVAQQQRNRKRNGSPEIPLPQRGGDSSRVLATNDGKGILFVSHTGEIYPSGFLPLRCGKFPDDHVVSVYQHSAIFRNLRDSSRLQGKCGICEYREICGGSRARAYAVTGNAHGEDPYCAYLPGARA
jgi:radical SAM protein with 4Fe4S-binding SPASM domain